MATVLIVDDDPKLLTMLRCTLAYEGFQVLCATNGTEALGEVQAAPAGCCHARLADAGAG